MTLADVPEGFLVTVPRSFIWTSRGAYWVDRVLVSEAVYELAYAGDLVRARAAWLEDVGTAHTV